METPTNSDADAGMDARQAAAILEDARARADRGLRTDHRVTFAIWGCLWLFGYGSIWLILRSDQPASGDVRSGAFAAIVLLTAVVAVIATSSIRAQTGVAGASVRRLRLILLSYLAGLVGVFLLDGAIVRAGANAEVNSIYQAAAPILVIGLIHLVVAIGDRNWLVVALGFWLVLVGGLAPYAGPVNVWGVSAIAVGPAFLLAAAFQPWLTRARRS